jgi:hypothetical protein
MGSFRSYPIFRNARQDHNRKILTCADDAPSLPGLNVKKISATVNVTATAPRPWPKTTPFHPIEDFFSDQKWNGKDLRQLALVPWCRSCAVSSRSQLVPVHSAVVCIQRPPDGRLRSDTDGAQDKGKINGNRNALRTLSTSA